MSVGLISGKLAWLGRGSLCKVIYSHDWQADAGSWQEDCFSLVGLSTGLPVCPHSMVFGFSWAVQDQVETAMWFLSYSWKSHVLTSMLLYRSHKSALHSVGGDYVRKGVPGDEDNWWPSWTLLTSGRNRIFSI